VRLFKAPHLVGCRSDRTYPALHSQLRSRGPLKTHRQRGVSSVSGILDVLECRVGFDLQYETGVRFADNPQNDESSADRATRSRLVYRNVGCREGIPRGIRLP
jgi:hypothetical protein